MRVFIAFTATVILASTLLPLCSCDLIDSACKGTPNYQLCVSTLRSNPKSHSADITGLSLIMVDAVKDKATSALQIISKLEKLHPQKKNAFRDCRFRYSVVQKYNVGEAVEALTKGDQKFAVDGMSDAAIEAQICEENFKPSPSPMTKMNKAVQDLSLVAAAIIRLLL
jgi:pectinesterase inhibitor-like protein